MRLIIADDHPLFLEAARVQVERAWPDAEIEVAGSLDDALSAAAGAGKVDAVLLDVGMPGMNGPASLARARATLRDTPIVLMSGSAAPADVAALIQAGANGFLPKTLGPAVFVQALNVVLAGGTYLPAELLNASMAPPGATVPDPADRAAADTPAPGTAVPGSVVPGAGGTLTLTPREVQVLRAIVNGRSNKEIARELDLQEVTVKLHARRAYQKLGARNRAEATAIAIEQKIVQRGG